MKHNIKSLLIAGGAMIALASCSENSWNDLYLDGFEGGYTPTDVRTVEYTLTAADYARISDNRFNKALAAKQDVSDALAAVKTQNYLNASIPAEEYIPNLLKDSLFTYFALSDGSAINLTYCEAGELPETMLKLNSAKEYIISDADYQIVYGSSDDYAASFSPSHPASSGIPKVLAEAFDEANEGDYVIVNYNNSDTDPVFGDVPTPPVPEFTMSSVLTPDLAKGDDITVNGVVTAVCNAGIILTDNAGSILVYASGFPAADYKVGDQVIATGTLSSYKNCLQLPYDDNLQKAGEQAYTYPAHKDLTPDWLLAAGTNTEPVLAVYGSMTGKVTIDGNYYNVYFDGREDVRGSIYNATDAIKAKLEDGKTYTLYGYFTQTSNSGTYTNCNFVVTDVASPAAGKGRQAPRRIVSIPSVNLNAAYVFNGSKWEAAGSDIVVVNPGDYAAMGLTYGNFSGTQAQEYLPLFLKQKFPYAQAETAKFVAYKYYSNNTTAYACTQFTFDGSKWEDSMTRDGVRSVTNQFVRRDGEWKLDPSIELTLPAGKNQPLSSWFFQACVDWVKENVPDGASFVTSYGNNDYYTGASAYQGNIDLRPGSARNQSSTYDDMTDDEIVALMKERFEKEVCPGVLATLYPNLAPVGDFEPTVTIHFFSYNGSSTTPGTIVCKAVAKGKFEFVSCDWDTAADE
jgi:hypothetical protein